jgi:hypothetical protein
VKKRRSKKKPEPLLDELHRRWKEGDDMPNLVARELVQKDQTGTHYELAKELRP